MITLARLYLLIAIISCTFSQKGTAQIVDTSKQKYSYAEMMDDLKALQKLYPECITCSDGDKTCQGRVIPIVTFGSPDAKHKMMVQASIHAREYMSTLVVMSLLEHYARNYTEGEYKGKKIKDTFNDVCLVILPMVNPDGVEIAQKGEKGAVTGDVREWVRQTVAKGTPYNQIKSNARGVDLNRNFRNGFGKDRRKKNVKGFSHYPGPEPYSEAESKLLLKVAEQHDFDCFLNYHTCGNLVYYGCKNATAAVNAKALAVSKIIKQHTAFPLYGPDSAPECGSWADEVEVLYQKPSATIELGTKNPVPLQEYNTLFKKNLWIWADLADALVNGGL